MAHSGQTRIAVGATIRQSPQSAVHAPRNRTCVVQNAASTCSSTSTPTDNRQPPGATPPKSPTRSATCSPVTARSPQSPASAATPSTSDATTASSPTAPAASSNTATRNVACRGAHTNAGCRSTTSSTGPAMTDQPKPGTSSPRAACHRQHHHGDLAITGNADLTRRTHLHRPQRQCHRPGNPTNQTDRHTTAPTTPLLPPRRRPHPERRPVLQPPTPHPPRLGTLNLRLSAPVVPCAARPTWEPALRRSTGRR
jgi:hypothetical protein